MKKETPMMEQYHSIKSRNRDSILLFRLGDFYEMFEKDAVAASSILNITLTKRNNIPMCGFPYHAAGTYIARLINEGQKIAICEQREDPVNAKGIVKREVVEIISPGMITDPDLLKNKINNCIAALFGSAEKGKIRLACACLDISTGEFLFTHISEEDVTDTLLNEIENNGIREIIYPESFIETEPFSLFLKNLKRLKPDVMIRGTSDYQFSPASAEEVLKNQFLIATPDILELRDELDMIACGAVLSYVKENIKREISHIRWVREKRKEDILIIDNATKKHLELIENQIDGSGQATLLSILDRTVTAMGGRLLKKYIAGPSRSITVINNRLLKVGYFFDRLNILESIRKELSNILDIERIIAKLSVGRGNARDLIGLKNSLISIDRIREELMEIEEFREEGHGIQDFKRIIDFIFSSIEEDPPLSIKDGGLIKSGYNEKLDDFRKVNLENREWINRYQGEERQRTGISSLKVKYNKIIGYYIEVTKPNINLVPPSYFKKQTLVNAERFTTEELGKHETLLMEARESSNTLELSLFEDIKKSVLSSTGDLFGASEIVARLDVFGSLALVARENNYVMPEIVEDNIVDIKGGRHPVIEKLGEESFIENDLSLNDTDRRIMILTGPNMAGKSTYLRQSALIVIMAQMGSFVPAKSAVIGLIDRVFSRLGMSDRLVKGESTFLVEMIETSRILHYASDRSLIIMDEIGRGTSTYDGLAIAWAVIEYLLDVKLTGAKVLFATHYHEITVLGKSYGVINYNATVREWNNSVIFLRKIVPGSASKSYGVEVARMAGLPDSVIDRAKSILIGLEAEYGSYVSHLMEQAESNKIPCGGCTEETTQTGEAEDSRAIQLGLFPSVHEILINELKDVDVDKITPLEALTFLDRLKKSLIM